MCLTIASEYLDRLRFGAGDRISARRSTAGVHWLATCFAVLVAGLAAAPRVQGQDALETRLLIAAAEIERAHELDELLAEHRLEIKPIVLQLLEEGIGRELDGDGEGASESYRIAARIAGAFERQFGEQSLIEAVSYVDKWTLDQKRAKLHADGLLAKGRELRSGEEAFAAYSQALELYRSISDRLGEAEVLGGLAVVYWYAGEPDSTLDYLERALAAREAVDDRKLIGNSFSDIGSALYAFYSDYQGALDYLRRAASIRQAIGDLEPLARNYALIGRTHDELGNLDSARTYLESAVTLFRQLGRTEDVAGNLSNLGSVLMYLDRSSEALAALAEAAELYRTLGNTAMLASSLNWIGATYRRVGDYEAAVSVYQEAIELAESIADSSMLGYLHVNLGALLDYAGRGRQSIPQLERALSLFDTQGDEYGRYLALLNLSNSHNFAGALDKAESYAQEALDVGRALGRRDLEARALVTLGNVQGEMGQGEAALASFSLAMEQAEELEYPDILWTALLGLGDHFDRTGDYAKAIEFYEEALDLTEQLRGRLVSEDEKAGFLAQRRFAYEHVIHMLGKWHEIDPDGGHDVHAFEAAERSKARAFLDMLAISDANLESTIDPELRRRQETLSSEIAGLTRTRQQASQAGERETVKTIRQRLNELDREYQLLQNQIRVTNPSYSAIQFPEPVTIADVQRDLIDDETVLLQYALGDSSSAMWVATRKSRAFISLPARPQLQEKVEVLRFALESPDEHGVELYASAARDLYEMLVSPAEDYLDEGHHLIVIPDGFLFLVPFEALLMEPVVDGASFADLPYLIRRHSVSYGQSASVLHRIQTARGQSPEPDRDLLAFGDPIFDLEETESGPAAADLRSGAPSDILRGTALKRLPYSGAEVDGIASLFPAERVRALTREEAREEEVKRDGALLGFRYIHFATHGLIDERRPDFSSIVLTLDDDPAEDGYLQAAEIFNLRMNPELVVLSACETGLGKIVQGEGIVGLTRAFMYAGAPSVLVSLWSVADESTSALMQSFYQTLAVHGERKVDALRAAKLELIGDASHAHPFYWAPFVILGDVN